MFQAIIKFPEISLKLRDGHKLRGYFAEMFKEKSNLLHNHFSDGKNIYRYPLVQYKVVENIPILIGLEDGARLLIDLFLDLKEIIIDSNTYKINSKNLTTKNLESGVINDLITYNFISPWIALNPNNYRAFVNQSENDQRDKLKAILTGNILSFFKGIDYYEHENIMLTTNIKQITVKFKNQDMIGFKGIFTTNVLLPDLIGLGKSPARGFGTIIKI